MSHVSIVSKKLSFLSSRYKVRVDECVQTHHSHDFERVISVIRGQMGLLQSEVHFCCFRLR